MIDQVIITPQYPKIRPDRDRFRKWYVDEPFNVKVYLKSGKTIEIQVDKGYRFDGHTVPPVIRWFFLQTDGLDLYASLVHDLLIDLEMFLRLNRKTQDLIYTKLMDYKMYRTSKFRSKWMPRAVRMAGFFRHTLLGDDRGTAKKITNLKITLNEI